MIFANIFAAAAAFATPFQPWSSLDGNVHLLRALAAQVSRDDQPVGSLMTPGWRLLWDGGPATPGRLIVRLSFRVVPAAPETKSSEYLQVGASHSRSAVRNCLGYGISGASGTRRPDRIINGRRFAVWENSDAGMSQQISATDLRTVAGGVCYAVERFRYSDSASELDPSVILSQARGAAALDAALASPQIGPLTPDQVLRPPTIKLPPGAVAR